MDEAKKDTSMSAPSGENPSDRGPESAVEEAIGVAPRSRRLKSYFNTLLITVFVAFILKTFVIEAFRIPSGSMENTLLVGDFLLVNKLAYGLKTPRYVPLTNLAIPTLSLPASSRVRRGDVVVFEYPGPREQVGEDVPVYYIKRCVGDPGDTILIRSGRVMVNEREVLPPTQGKSSVYAGASEMAEGNNYGPTIVPKRGDTIEVSSESLKEWKEFIEREHHHVQIDSTGKVMIDGARASRYTVQHNYYFMLGDNRGNSSDSRFWGYVPDDYIIGEALVVYWSWDPGTYTGGIVDRLRDIRWNRIGTLIR
jgi:signal peptidase I